MIRCDSETDGTVQMKEEKRVSMRPESDLRAYFMWRTMFNSIPEILRDLKDGRMVVMVDDEDRENEGDLIVAASACRPEHINFMVKHGRGLVCVPMQAQRLEALGLEPMAPSTKDPFSTAWMMSVDAASGVTTGISAYDRSRTIEVLINPQSKPEDLARPGHVFPLRSRDGGVLVRAGHTEAAVDMMRLAGLYPAGVICEIMNEDGSMARLPQLLEFSRRHKLKICSIAGLIEYRRKSEKLVERSSAACLPTEFGTFTITVFKDVLSGQSHVALTMGQWRDEPVLVRVHSECLTGDVFASRRCDCGRQLHEAMRRIGSEKKGVILYMRQEGRGIGLEAKISAYALQDKGLDTVEANLALGFKPDLRDYGIGAQILADLKVKRIRLLTNNPRKIVGLEGYGLEVVERVPLQVPHTESNYGYLKTKKEKLGHQLDM